MAVPSMTTGGCWYCRYGGDAGFRVSGAAVVAWTSVGDPADVDGVAHFEEIQRVDPAGEHACQSYVDCAGRSPVSRGRA
jgi:hypothetical protein